jgi:hypothetical protein
MSLTGPRFLSGTLAPNQFKDFWRDEEHRLSPLISPRA